MAGEKHSHSRCQVVLTKLSVHLADISVALRNECLTIKLSQFIVSNSKARFFFQPNIKKFKICASICFIFRQPVIVLLTLTSNFPVLNSVIYLVRPNGDFFPRKSGAATSCTSCTSCLDLFANEVQGRLDFRRSLVSGLRSSGEERGLLPDHSGW